MGNVGNIGYRPSGSRCVHVFGEINERLVHDLSRVILRFRLESNEPITAFFDSPGGSVFLADSLFWLLTGPNIDGDQCHVLTYAVGTAASAAAIFLARGAYAVADAHAFIHFHGLRRQSDAELTTERAAAISSVLQEQNDRYALLLARSCISRFFLLSNVVKLESPLKTDDPRYTQQFAAHLATKLSPDIAALVNRAAEKCQQVANLSDFVFSKLRFGKKATIGQRQAALLKLVLDYELKHQPKEWNLSQGGLDHVRRDFLQLADYLGGAYRGDYSQLASSFSTLLLTPEETQESATIDEADNKRAAWIEARVQPRLSSLWYFVVSLCRLLYEGENPLSAVDAYWVGLVDEVVGTDLPNLRVLMEAAAKKAAEGAAPVAAT